MTTQSLPITRTTANTPEEHAADHNALHGMFDDLQVSALATLTPDRLLVAEGAPNIAVINGTAHGYLLDPAATESVYGSFKMEQWHGFSAGATSPSANLEISVLWTNAGAGAGNVRFSVAVVDLGSGVSLPATFGTAVGVTAGAGAQNLIVRTILSTTSIVFSPDRFYGIRVQRLGADAADTLANDIAVFAVELRHA